MSSTDPLQFAPSQHARLPDLTLQNPRDRVTQQDPAFELHRHQLRRQRTLTGPEQDPQNPQRQKRKRTHDAAFDAHREALRAERKARDVRLLHNVRAFTETDSDLAAEVDRLALDLDMDRGLVEGNIEQVRQLWRERQFDTFRRSRGNEMTMRAFLDPHFARLSADDVPALSFIENLARQREAGLLEDEVSLLWHRVMAGRATDADVARLDRIQSRLLDLPHDSDVGGFFENLAYGAARLEARMESTLTWAMAYGLSLAGTTAVAGAATPVPGDEVIGPIGAFGVGATVGFTLASYQRESGAAYASMIDMGVDPSTARAWANSAGVVNALLESTGMRFVAAPFKAAVKTRVSQTIAKDMLTTPTTRSATTQFLKNYAAGLGGETGTEVMQEMVNMIAEEGAVFFSDDKSKLDLEGQLGFADRMGAIIGETLRGMALIALPGPVLNLRANLHRAQRSQMEAAWVQEFGVISEQSKLRARSDETFAQFTQQVLMDTDAHTVHVDFETFVETMEQTGFDRASLQQIAPDVARDLKNAEQTGTVEIPTSDYGARFFVSKFGKQLAEHTRLTPDSMSQAELSALPPDEVQLRVEEAKRDLDIKNKEETQIDREVNAVESEFAAQIQAAGRKPAEASAAATIYGAWIQRLAKTAGMSPAEFHQKHGLQFFSEEDAAELFDSERALTEGVRAPEAEQAAEGERAAETEGEVELPAREQIFRELRQELSTRLPTGAKAIEDPGVEVLTTDYSTALRDKGKLAQNAATIRKEMPFLRLDDATTDEDVVEAYIEHVADNLDWLYNQMAPEDRARSRLWYDGGRKRVEQWARRYGISPMQSAAMIAVLSPQREWFANMSMTERMLDIMTAAGQHTWDADMTKTANRRIRKIPRPKGVRLKDAKENIYGKKLDDVRHNRAWAAYWIRVYDATHNERSHRRMTPEGGAAGDNKSAIIWSGYDALAKVVSIMDDGSWPNVSLQLGKEHKVRNFYNNLFAPNSKRGHVTIDTHAVAAAYLMPLTSGHRFVQQAWGGKGGATDVNTGLLGFYPLLAEAYRRAAEQHGMLPREMQSITWEQVRALFTPGQKRTELRIEDMESRPSTQIWRRYQAGEIEIDEARAEVVEQFKGFEDLEWRGLPADTSMTRTYRGASAQAMRGKGDVGAKANSTEVMVEAKPNKDPDLMARWEGLSDEERVVATQQILDTVVPAVLAEAETSGDVVAQRGAWLGSPEPSIAVSIDDPDKAVQVADLLGEALHQEGMFIMSLDPGQGLQAGAAVTIDLPIGYTAAQVDRLYTDLLWPLKGPEGQDVVVGHSTQGRFMTIGLDEAQAGVTADELVDRIIEALGDEAGSFIVRRVDLHSAFRSHGSDYASDQGTAEPTAGGAPAQEGLGGVQRIAAEAYERALGGGQRVLAQGPLGRFLPDFNVALLSKDANPSTVFHEMVHFFAQAMIDMVNREAAPTQVLADVDTMLEWFGIEGTDARSRLDAWNAMPFAKQTKHHEALAGSWELYLYEGKAPSSKLQKLFDRIRTFMVQAYRAVKAKLNARHQQEFGEDLPALSKEMRMVFDRMVAAEDFVTATEQQRQMIALSALQSKEEFIEAGGTESLWNEMQELEEAAHNQAVADMTARSERDLRWLSNAQSTVLKNLQEEERAKRDALEPNIRAEILAEPVRQVMATLRGEKAAEKMNEAAVAAHMADVHPDARDEVLTEKFKGLVSKSGVDPVFWAELGGFRDVRTLVDAIIEAKPLEIEVQERITEKLIEQNGELRTERQMQEAVNKALANEARIKLYATQVQFLEKSTQPRRAFLTVMKQVAREILNGRKLNDIRPERFLAAATKAGRDVQLYVKGKSARKAFTDKHGRFFEAVEAVEPDPAKAARAMRQQLLNTILAQEAWKVRIEIEKAISSVNKVLNRSTQKLADFGNVDLLMAARFVMAQHGMASHNQSTRTVNYLKRVREYDPGLFSHLEPELRKAQEIGSELGRLNDGTPNHRELKLDDFRAAIETADMLIHRAREDKIVADGDKHTEVAAMVGELIEQLSVPDVLPGQKKAVSDMEKAKMDWATTKTNFIRFEQLLRKMDGNRSGGPFQRAFSTNIRDGLSNYRLDAAAHVKQLVDMLNSLQLENGTFHAEHLDYEFGNKTGNGRMELLAALLHTGNLGNLERLLVGGRPNSTWADFDAEGNFRLDKDTRWNRQIRQFIEDGVLKQEHFEFVQGVWDLLESIKPTLQATHKKLKGFTFNEVEARPFTITFADGEQVTYRGGYVPARQDRDLPSEDRVEITMQQFQENFYDGIPKAPDGAFQDRKAHYNGRHMDLDLMGIAAHIDETLRFAHVAIPINDALKILNGTTVDENGQTVSFRGVMNKVNPNFIGTPEKPGLVMQFLNRVAKQQAYEPSAYPTFDKLMKAMRRNAGVLFMFGNVVNTMQQLTGLSNARLYVERRFMKTARSVYMRGPREMTRVVAEKSKFMRDRMESQMFEMTADLREAALRPGLTRKLGAWAQRKAYFLQATMQNQVDKIVWWGAYQQEIEKGSTDTQAIAEADSVVRLSQGSFNVEDRANIEVGSATKQAFMQFTSYFLTALNQITLGPGHPMRRFVWSLAIPAIAAEAISMFFYGKFDDEDDDGHFDTFGDLLIMSQVRMAGAMVPVVGPTLVGLGESAFTGRPMGDRFGMAPSHVAFYRSVLGLASTTRAIFDEEQQLTGRKIRDAWTAVGLFLPAAGALAPAMRPISYLTDVAGDDVEPTNALDVGLGLVSGRASEASRR